MNTVFEVARAHGLRTAWSDKHPAYEILQRARPAPASRTCSRPRSTASPTAPATTGRTDNALTQEYDSTKVAAVLNEIDG